jgi:hypothetical protein
MQFFYSSISLAEAAGNSWLSTGQMLIAGESQPIRVERASERSSSAQGAIGQFERRERPQQTGVN